MATKTQITPSSSSRVRFGFGLKQPQPRPRVPPETPERASDADWYTPYNGPYELPPSSNPRSQDRDSWGQLLGSVLSSLGSARSSEAGHDRSDGGRMASGQVMGAFPSSGTYSSHPYRTNAAPDAAAGTPGPPAMGSQGRGAIAQSLRGGRPAMIATSSTAFANMDSTGGVGESPMPVQRLSPLHTSPPPTALNRPSLASFLTFGGSARKSRSERDSVQTSASRQPSRKRSHTGTLTSDPLQSNRATTLDARTSPSHSPSSLEQTTERRSRQRSHTLISTSMSPVQSSSPSHDSSANSFYSRYSPLSSHPYAHTSRTAAAPRLAPIVSTPAVSSLDKGKGVDRSYQYPRPPAPDTLNSPEVPAHLKPASRTSLFKAISAPNLRNLSRGISVNKPAPSRAKYRWLSPETWCDALLFPRPRFMAYIDDDPPPQSFGHRHATPMRSPDVRIGRELTNPPPQTALRGSHSAVNLHVESSRGPPRAEPMLMARGSSNAKGLYSPTRPRSFAQDDLALPSPAPSLTRVLEMGASFDRERAAWKAQAARSLQSSKRTRSLGRSRSQSAGRTRAQLKNAGGVGFLATKTLLGNQFAAPVIHSRTPSDGTQTRSATSHVRTMSSGGISRAGSKGKAALRAATGLCISDDKISLQDQRGDPFSRIDGHGQDTRIRVEAVAAVAPSADVGPSPSPPMTSNCDVGVALSSPPASEGGHSEEAFVSVHVQGHPHDESRQSMSRRSHARSSSDYAGPHPSAVSIAVPPAALTSDMSARHRLPPHAALHPYASALAYPNTASSQQADTQPWPAQRQPTHRPQLAIATETGRVAPHAYASGNQFGGEPLIFADALVIELERRGSADSGLGDSETHYEAPANARRLYSPLPNLVLSIPSEPPRPDPSRGSTFLSLRSSQATSTPPPESANPPVFTASVLSYSLHSMHPNSSADEPLPGSRASSPQRSPQPIEDLDRYRNLFYSPRGQGLSRSPSDEQRRVLSRDTTGADASASSHVSGGSSLTMLTRQLSTELEAIAIQDRRRRDGGARDSLRGGPSNMWGLRYGGLRGGDGMGSRTDPNAVLSITTRPEMSSLEPTTLPLSLHRSIGHRSDDASLAMQIPQDVDSRTSSVLDRSEMEDHHHHDELLRLGTVEAVSTPVATIPTHRLSFMGVVHGADSQESLLRAVAAAVAADDNDDVNDYDEEDLIPPPPLMTSPGIHQISDNNRASLLPAPLSSATTEVTRSSYQTDATGTSRISGLSDFPVPPTQTVVSSDRVEMLKSYFADGDGGDEGSGSDSQAGAAGASTSHL